MSSDRQKPGILSLLFEIRQPIILEVLPYVVKTPTPTPKAIEQRARLINCFDEREPRESNIYVKRTKNNRLNGNALLATNRTLAAGDSGLDR